MMMNPLPRLARAGRSGGGRSAAPIRRERRASTLPPIPTQRANSNGGWQPWDPTRCYALEHGAGVQWCRQTAAELAGYGPDPRIQPDSREGGDGKPSRWGKGDLRIDGGPRYERQFGTVADPIPMRRAFPRKQSKQEIVNRDIAWTRGMVRGARWARTYNEEFERANLMGEI